MIFRWLLVALLSVAAAVSGLATGTTTADAEILTYDTVVYGRVEVRLFDIAGASTMLLSEARQPASPTHGVQRWSPTPTYAGVATNTADDVLRSVDDVTGGLSPGRQPHVRTVSSPGELQTVYDDLATGGVPTEWSGYKGTVVRRPDGVEVGIRGSSTSGGATIDIRLPDGTTQKVHIAG